MKAEADPRGVVRVRRVAAREGLEAPFSALGGDARSAIGDLEDHLPVDLERRESDRSPPPRLHRRQAVLLRVLDEVGDDALDAHRRGADDRQVVVQVEFDPASGERHEASAHPPHDLREVERFEASFRARLEATGELGAFQDAVDQLVQAQRLALDAVVVEPFLRRFQPSVPQEVEVDRDRRDRGAQLVRHRGGEGLEPAGAEQLSSQVGGQQQDSAAQHAEQGEPDRGELAEPDPEAAGQDAPVGDDVQIEVLPRRIRTLDLEPPRQVDRSAHVVRRAQGRTRGQSVPIGQEFASRFADQPVEHVGPIDFEAVDHPERAVESRSQTGLDPEADGFPQTRDVDASVHEQRPLSSRVPVPHALPHARAGPSLRDFVTQVRILEQLQEVALVRFARVQEGQRLGEPNGLLLERLEELRLLLERDVREFLHHAIPLARPALRLAETGRRTRLADREPRGLGEQEDLPQDRTLRAPGGEAARLEPCAAAARLEDQSAGSEVRELVLQLAMEPVQVRSDGRPDLRGERPGVRFEARGLLDVLAMEAHSRHAEHESRRKAEREAHGGQDHRRPRTPLLARELDRAAPAARLLGVVLAPRTRRSGSFRHPPQR